MDGRRALAFSHLADVMPDVDQLLPEHTTIGQWTLAQILYHLAVAVRSVLKPRTRERTSTPEQDALRAQFFEAAQFPEGRPIPLEILVPPPELNLNAEAESLRTAIADFETATGPFPAHPRLGPMTKGEWERFHAIHCAHHLSFALPATRPT
jgi:hypothetical protein